MKKSNVILVLILCVLCIVGGLFGGKYLLKDKDKNNYQEKPENIKNTDFNISGELLTVLNEFTESHSRIYTFIAPIEETITSSNISQEFKNQFAATRLYYKNIANSFAVIDCPFKGYRESFYCDDGESNISDSIRYGKTYSFDEEILKKKVEHYFGENSYKNVPFKTQSVEKVFCENKNCYLTWANAGDNAEVISYTIKDSKIESDKAIVNILVDSSRHKCEENHTQCMYDEYTTTNYDFNYEFTFKYVEDDYYGNHYVFEKLVKSSIKE